MRNTRLLNLFMANKAKGSFKAEGNTIFIYDIIVGSDAEAEFWGGVSPEAFAKALFGLKGDVHLRIDSPGGDVFAARAMQQAIREYDGNVIAHVDGYAASAASLVAVTGSKTIMAPGSMMMIHEAWTIAMGSKRDFLSTAALLEQIDGSIAETYAQKAGKEPGDFTALIEAETWFTAQGAVDAGLADEVAQEKPKKNAKASWNLAAFEHAPQIADDDAEKGDEPAVIEEIAPEQVKPIEQRQRQHAARMLEKTV